MIDYSFYNWLHYVYRVQADEQIGLYHWQKFREWENENLQRQSSEKMS